MSPLLTLILDKIACQNDGISHSKCLYRPDEFVPATRCWSPGQVPACQEKKAVILEGPGRAQGKLRQEQHGAVSASDTESPARPVLGRRRRGFAPFCPAAVGPAKRLAWATESWAGQLNRGRRGRNAALALPVPLPRAQRRLRARGRSCPRYGSASEGTREVESCVVSPSVLSRRHHGTALQREFICSLDGLRCTT